MKVCNGYLPPRGLIKFQVPVDKSGCKSQRNLGSKICVHYVRKFTYLYDFFKSVVYKKTGRFLYLHVLHEHLGRRCTCGVYNVIFHDCFTRPAEYLCTRYALLPFLLLLCDKFVHLYFCLTMITEVC